MANEEKSKKRKIINTTTVGMSQNELIQRNGEAAGQIIQGYKGVRYDNAGNELEYKGRSLKDISKYKVNKDYKSQNIKQQSGFSAEIIKEARDNKEAIKSGNLNRTTTTDGIGQSNHQQYDHVILDENGNIISGSGSQMKFLNIDAKGRVTVVEKIVNDSTWDKYDGYIDIPEDQYDVAIKYAETKAEELQRQANEQKASGNFEKAKELQNKSDKYEKSKKKLRKSNVKESEAIEARITPEKFVIKEVIKDSHNAGIEAAKGAAILGGSISCAQNIYCVLNDDKSIDEAVIDIAKTTGKVGVTAYGIGASGTAIKSIMHTSKNTLTRGLSTTNAPAMIATATVEIGKSIKRYINEDIDEVELLEELGEKGTGMIAAGFGTAVGTAVGTIILPGAGSVVGGLVGGMISYTISGVLYKTTLDAFKGAKISSERRIVMEQLSRECIREMQRYQKILTESAIKEFKRREDVLSCIFHDINESILENNIDGLLDSINGIGEELGVSLEFNTFEEFETAIDDDNFILIL